MKPDYEKINQLKKNFIEPYLPIQEQKLSFDDCLTDLLRKENFKCSICLNIVWHNHRTCSKCQEFFCEDCIKDWFVKNQSCPQCREYFSKRQASKFEYKILDALEFKCKNQDCGEKFIYKDALKHIKKCSEVKAECVITDCKE